MAYWRLSSPVWNFCFDVATIGPRMHLQVVSTRKQANTLRVLQLGKTPTVTTKGLTLHPLAAAPTSTLLKSKRLHGIPDFIDCEKVATCAHTYSAASMQNKPALHLYKTVVQIQISTRCSYSLTVAFWSPSDVGTCILPCYSVTKSLQLEQPPQFLCNIYNLFAITKQTLRMYNECNTNSGYDTLNCSVLKASRQALKRMWNVTRWVSSHPGIGT